MGQGDPWDGDTDKLALLGHGDPSTRLQYSRRRRVFNVCCPTYGP